MIYMPTRLLVKKKNQFPAVHSSYMHAHGHTDCFKLKVPPV